MAYINVLRSKLMARAIPLTVLYSSHELLKKKEETFKILMKKGYCPVTTWQSLKSFSRI